MFGLSFGAVLFALGPWIALFGSAFYLGLRYVRTLERRAAARGELADVSERILRLEEDLSTMGERLNRLAEGQEFTTRLLADRKEEATRRPD